MPQRLPVFVSVYSEDRKALPNFYSIFGISPTKYDNDNSIYRIVNEEIDSFAPVYFKECKFSKKEFPKLFTSHINSRINSSSSKLEVINGKVETIQVYRYIAIRRDLFSTYTLWYSNKEDSKRKFNLWDKLLYVNSTKIDNKWTALGAKSILPPGILELFSSLELSIAEALGVRESQLFITTSQAHSEEFFRLSIALNEYIGTISSLIRTAKHSIISNDAQVASGILESIKIELIRYMNAMRGIASLCIDSSNSSVNQTYWLSKVSVATNAVSLLRQLSFALPYAPPEVYLDLGLSPRMFDSRSPSHFAFTSGVIDVGYRR